MLKFHGRLSCFLLSVIVVIIIFSVDSSDDQLEIWRWIWKCLFGSINKVIIKFGESSFTDEDISTSFKILKIFIVWLFGEIEYLFHSYDKSLKFLKIFYIAISIIQKFLKYLFFQSLILILPWFILWRECQRKDITDRWVTKILKNEIKVLVVLIQKFKEIFSLSSQQWWVYFMNIP